MNRILIIFCHPALENSRVNRAWVDRATRTRGVVVHDLYELYPNFDVDIAREQALLSEHDIVILQHPLYWYSPPALLKQWFELTLQHGWAYGDGGHALAGKLMMNAISTGGIKQAYTPDGFHEATLDQFLLPVRQTAQLCGLTYLAPFVAHGVFKMGEEEVNHTAEDYGLLLESLRDRKVNVEVARTRDYFNPRDTDLFEQVAT